MMKGTGVRGPERPQSKEEADALVATILAEREAERMGRMKNNAFATIKAKNNPPRVRVNRSKHVHQEVPAGRLYAHTHTHQHTFALGVDSFHMTRLHQNWQPGMGGNPDADFNHGAHTEELDSQLRATDRTLAALHEKNEAAIKGHLAGPGAEQLRYAARTKINESLVAQMEFFTASCQRWAGVPLGHRAHVAQLIRDEIAAGALDIANSMADDWDAKVRKLYDSIPHRPDPYPALPV